MDFDFAVQNQILLLKMIDRTLGFAPVQQQSYYFQLIPLSLTIVNKDSQIPAPGTTYRFTIFKGQQKFDENRIPIQATFTTANKLPVLPITTCRLNFYIPSVNRQRKVEFNLRMTQRESNQDFELGDYTMDVNQLVQQFKQKGVNRHELKSNFSQDYELEFEIYVDTSRVNLEKNIREKKFDRASKSPLRSRREGEQPSSARKNLAQQSKVESRVEETPSKDVETVQQVKEQARDEAPVENPVYYQAEKVETRQSRQQNQRPASTASREQKNEKPEGSVKSKNSLPLVQTKYKPISKIGTPSEVKMTESQRLASGGVVEEPVVKSSDQSTQEKVFLWASLAVGMLFIYWAMHPSSKV